MAQLTKEELKEKINTLVENNTSGKVSPEDVRTSLFDIIDSIELIGKNEDFQSLEGDNTRAGSLALYQPGQSTSNTGTGKNALRGVLDASGNTANGDGSLESNVYGHNNSATGKDSLGGNVRGHNNDAFGHFTLKGLKDGDNNLALGHGAGWYVGPNDSYQLYVASHNLTEQEMCDLPSGDPAHTPLLRGDFLNGRLAVNTNDLNDQGALQVNGNLVPSYSGSGDQVGTATREWASIHVGEISSAQDITVNSTLLPANQAALGDASNRWETLHVKNIDVEGSANITNITYTDLGYSQFHNKILYLGVSGVDSNLTQARPYLTDEGLDGAGFVVRSSGVDYQRDYSFTFNQPDLTITGLETDDVYSKAYWSSNISLALDSGRHLRTDRVLGRSDLDLVNSGQFGLFISDSLVVAREDDLSLGNGIDKAALFISESGQSYEHALLGEDVSYSLLDYTGEGFKVGYDTEQFTIAPTNGTLQFAIPSGQNTASLTSSGDTLFAVLGSGDSELSVGEGGLFYDRSANSLIIQDSGTDVAFLSQGWFGLAVAPNAALTIGKDGANNAVVSFAQTDSGNAIPTTSDFGQLFVKAVEEPNRSQALYFQDDSGNVQDLMHVVGDVLADEFVYWDVAGNTFAGKDTVPDRTTIPGLRNTGFGNGVFENLSGGNNNLAYGYNGGLDIVDANNTISIGNYAGRINQDNTLFIGNDNPITKDIDPIISGEIPTGDTEGRLYLHHTVSVQDQDKEDFIKFSHDVDKTAIISKVDANSENDYPDTGLNIRLTGQQSQDIVKFKPSNKMVGEGNYYTRPTSRSSMELRGDLDLLGAVHFSDGTVLDTAVGVKTVSGSGVDALYDATELANKVSLNLSTLPAASSSIIDAGAQVPILTSGEHYAATLAQLEQFFNSENPQTFYVCPNGYNLVLSNSSTVDHSANCSTAFIGSVAGDGATGFTNSVLLGVEAGQNASMNNDNLSVDIGTVFIGARSGRNSVNCDNSVFIGPSAGNSAVGADNSIFVGNSAGNTSNSAHSIGIGDNSLVGVDGTNNLEILSDEVNGSRLILGSQSNKFNINGCVAGHSKAGRVTVGAGRIQPHATLEVAAHAQDSSVRLQEWFNAAGDLVAYLDQSGNMVIKGVVTEDPALAGDNRTAATNIPGALE